jgi:hypothetical protein
MRFDKFEQVVSWYERTKPMISKHHTKEHDVRPIGDRGRKWERIKKIDENTYALLDGNYGNTIWGSIHPEQHAWENTMAAITWMRREDGDFIRIRNHTRRNVSVTRYNFLHWHLPMDMRFHYNQQGQHWVRAKTPTGYAEFRLPKCDVRFDHGTKKFTDDNVYLMFRVNGDGTFTRVGEELEVEVKRVDKELKKQWRERVDSFYTYCAAIAPMIDTTWGGQQEYATLIREWRIAQLPAGGRIDNPWVRSVKHMPTELVREIVTQEEHPLRVAVAAMVIADIGGKRAIESQDDIRSIKAAYNRVMNQALGFYKIEKV